MHAFFPSSSFRAGEVNATRSHSGQIAAMEVPVFLYPFVVPFESSGCPSPGWISDRGPLGPCDYCNFLIPPGVVCTLRGRVHSLVRPQIQANTGGMHLAGAGDGSPGRDHAPGPARCQRYASAGSVLDPAWYASLTVLERQAGRVFHENVYCQRCEFFSIKPYAKRYSTGRRSRRPSKMERIRQRVLQERPIWRGDTVLRARNRTGPGFHRGLEQPGPRPLQDRKGRRGKGMQREG